MLNFGRQNQKVWNNRDIRFAERSVLHLLRFFIRILPQNQTLLSKDPGKLAVLDQK